MDILEGGADSPFIDADERLRHLLTSKASLRDVCLKGMSALGYCCSLFDEELALQVVMNGVDVDLECPVSGGYTPLHVACSANMPDLVRVLLEKRANLTAQSEDLRVIGHYETGGRTPLHIAAEKGADDIIKLLVQAGADVDAVDFDGNTPFILALMSKQYASADILRTRADPNPSAEWLSVKARQDRQNAAERMKSGVVCGTLLEVHIRKRVWTSADCEIVMKELIRYTYAKGWTSNRHRAYATTDVQVCDVYTVDAWVRKSIRQRLFPAMSSLYFGRDDMKFSFRDLFFVKYDARGQNYLDMHTDGSLLSFNILLNQSTEFEGGGTFFEHLQQTISGEQGDAVLHSGQVRHAGAGIQSGQRFLLVGFVDVHFPEAT